MFRNRYPLNHLLKKEVIVHSGGRKYKGILDSDPYQEIYMVEYMLMNKESALLVFTIERLRKLQGHDIFLRDLRTSCTSSSLYLRAEDI